MLILKPHNVNHLAELVKVILGDVPSYSRQKLQLEQKTISLALIIEALKLRGVF